VSERCGRAAVLAAAVLVYLNGLPGAFQFDDYNVIVDNPAVHSWGGWLASMPGIRPLLKLSYVLSWSHGGGAAGFRALNLLCHALNGLLVHALAVRWAAALGPRWAAPGTIGLAAALCFVLHPANTEAVTYVSGRSVSLMSCFYLGSLLTALRGWERDTPWLSLAASPALFLGALLTKETAWTLPLALWLWEATRPEAGWRRGLRRSASHWMVLLLAAPAMLAVPGYRRLLEVSLSTRTLAENLLTQIDGQWYLLSTPLLRLGMNIDPDLPVHTALNAGLALKGAALLLLLALGAVLAIRRPGLGLGVLWFFLHLLPTNAVLPRLDVANDRQLYLAMIGPSVVLASVLCAIQGRRLRLAAIAVFLLALGGATAARNLEYRSEVALWESTVRQSPQKARAWNNLGYAYQLAGETEAAGRAYQKALRLEPDHPRARANLEALSRPGGRGGAAALPRR
jgi:hypothetical protein